MNIGIGSYTFPWAIGVPPRLPPVPMTAVDLVDRAVALGVRVVQLCDNLPLAECNDVALDALRRYANARGVILQFGDRGSRPERLIRALRIAERLGSPILRVVPDAPDDRPTPEVLTRRIRGLLTDLRKCGIVLAIENHDRFQAREIADIVRSLQSPLVGVCLDTVNSFGALEGPDVVLDTLLPLTVNLHLKDFAVRRVEHQMGFVVEGCPIGRGRLDVPSLLERLEALGRNIDLIIELWTPPANTLDETLQREAQWAEESVRYLQAVLAAHHKELWHEK